MGRVRIDFGNHPTLYNKLQEAFYNENGHHADHFVDRFWFGKNTWESELTGWISAKGFLCHAWQDPPDVNGSLNLQKPLAQGLEMEEATALLFWITWS